MKNKNLKKLAAMFLAALVFLSSMPVMVSAGEDANQFVEAGDLDSLTNLNFVYSSTNDSILIGVTPANHDNIGRILNDMGIAFQVVMPNQLRNIDVLRHFDAIFINCASNPSANAVPSAPALRQFVSEGGVLYASDLAAPFLSTAFPGLVSFMSNSPSGHVTANITSPNLAQHMGRNQLNIILPGGGLIINQITPQATVYLERAVASSFE